MIAAVVGSLLLAAAPAVDAGVDGDVRVDGASVAGDGGPTDGAAADAIDAAPAPPAPPPPGAPAPRLAPLRGQVLAKGTRRPIPAASLTLGIDPLGDTDADGRFAFDVPCGRRRLMAQAPVFELGTVDVDACAGGPPLIFRLAPQLGLPTEETRVVAGATGHPQVQVEAEELTKTPGSLGDPFRVIESLPGVTTVQWPAPIYAVRGANPGNTGFFLDDVRVPALFHFALGPSVIHPYLFDRLDFYPGGYPARFGRYVSGLVSAQTRQPPDDAVHGAADVRLFDAGGLVSAPFPDGKGTVAIAGRYSYTGTLVSLLNENVALNYWDYQVRVQRPLGRLRLTLLVLGSGDRLAPKGAKEQQQELILRFHRATLRAELPVGDGRLVGSIAGGSNHSKSPLADMFPITVDGLELAPRLAYRRAGQHADVEIGVEGELTHYAPLLTIDRPQALDLVRGRNAQLLAAYASVTVRAGSRLVLTPELRADRFVEGGASENALGPRLGLRLRVAGETFINATGGRFTQMPSIPIQIPGAENFGLGVYGLQSSWQGSLGVETKRLANLEAQVTGYVQSYVLTDVRSTYLMNVDPLASDFLIRRDALAYGVEVMLRRPLRERLHGWLAYTLSTSQRALGNGVVAPSDWDQRHVLNLVMGYRMGRNTCGGRAHLNTGRPYPRGDNTGQLRLPTYYQIDLRCDRRWVFNSFSLELYAELQNATLSRQVLTVSASVPGQPPEQESVKIVLPSIGVHAEF